MNESSVMNLSIGRLALAYGFILILLIIFKARGIRRERQILIAGLRMTLQLTAMGYVLMAVFANASWWLTLLLVAFMLGTAIYNANKRVRAGMPRRLRLISGLSLTVGFSITVFIFIVLVLQVRPWYHPQYFIPISGMIAGNAMTGLALGANHLCDDMRDKRVELENSLMLGATPARACREIVNAAFDSAILPTMNNMLTIGIVSLPGMMTGQILSGTFPLTAIKYQIGIMLAILGGTALSTVLFVTLGYQVFFTKDGRLAKTE